MALKDPTDLGCFISRSVGEMDGAASVDGTGIRVVHVLGALRSSQAIVRHVQKFYPMLTGRQIAAAIRFARDEVERADEAWIRRERRRATKTSRGPAKKKLAKKNARKRR